MELTCTEDPEEMNMSESIMKKLSVKQLGDYLTKCGISPEAIITFSTNQVTGQALLLVDDGELRELLQTIGDRAVVRNILKQIRKVNIIIK